MILHPCVGEIATRYKSLDASVANGKLDLDTAISRYAWVVKDGTLGMAQLGASHPLEADDSEHSIPFTISVQEEDRDGDICVSLGCQLDDYARNPVICFGHQQYQNLPYPIAKSKSPDGKITVYPEQTRIRAVAYFDAADEDAMFIYGKIRRGFISACSQAFVPINAVRRDRELEKDLTERAHTHSQPMMPAGWLFKQYSLTEWSIVTVPACAGAVRDALDSEKSFISPRLYNAMLPYAAKSIGKSFSGWCPPGTVACPDGTCKSLAAARGFAGGGSPAASGAPREQEPPTDEPEADMPDATPPAWVKELQKSLAAVAKQQVEQGKLIAKLSQPKSAEKPAAKPAKAAAKPADPITTEQEPVPLNVAKGIGPVGKAASPKFNVGDKVENTYGGGGMPTYIEGVVTEVSRVASRGGRRDAFGNRSAGSVEYRYKVDFINGKSGYCDEDALERKSLSGPVGKRACACGGNGACGCKAAKTVTKVDPLLPSRSRGGEVKLPTRDVNRIYAQAIHDVFAGDQRVTDLPEWGRWTRDVARHYVMLRTIPERQAHRQALESAYNDLRAAARRAGIPVRTLDEQLLMPVDERSKSKAADSRGRPLSVGDRVEWDTEDGRVVGKVVRLSGERAMVNFGDVVGPRTEEVWASELTKKAVMKYITHEGSKWIVHAESGKVLGRHDTKESAERQLRAVEANKHKGIRSFMKAQPSDDISPDKACQILRDGEANGHPLTEDQRRMFGAACGRKKSVRKAYTPRVGDRVVVCTSDGNDLLVNDGKVTAIRGDHAEVKEPSGRVDEWPVRMLDAYANWFSKSQRRKQALAESSGSAGGYTVAVDTVTDSPTPLEGEVVCVECGGSGQCLQCDRSGECVACAGAGMLAKPTAGV